jgi:hypothetical protein
LFHGHLTVSVPAYIWLSSRLEKETDVHLSVGRLAYQDFRQIWRLWKRSLDFGSRPDADLHFPAMVSPSRAQKVKARENFTTC